MISTKATGQRLLSLFLSLCTALFIATIALPSFEAHAQTAQAPLDLGTVIQKGTPRQAPVYLKLPETVPIPAANPRKNGDQDATPEAANQQERQQRINQMVRLTIRPAQKQQKHKMEPR